MGKGREYPHRRTAGTEHARDQGWPLVQGDFAFYEAYLDRTKDPAEAVFTTMVWVDVDTGYPLVVATPGKDATEYLAKRTAAFISSLGHRQVTLRTDQEPAMLTLAARVQQLRSHPTRLQQSPVYSPQSKGKVEQTIGFIGGTCAL